MKNRKLTAIVTGSEGFIGQHLCAVLEKHEDVKQLIKFDKLDRHNNDLCSAFDVDLHIGRYEPDVVFHLASHTNVKYQRFTSSGHAIDNIDGTRLLLEYLPKHCRVVLASSVHVPYMRSLYAASKGACENLITVYHNMGLIEGVILRLTSVVGKGMTHGVVKDFMEKLRSDSTSLDIIGEAPGSLRPYIHIDDVVRGMIYYGLNIEKNKYIGHTISTDQSIYIDKVADIIMREMNVHKPKRWLGSDSNWVGDVDVITTYSGWLEDVGWKPFYTCEEAIAQAVKDNL